MQSTLQNFNNKNFAFVNSNQQEFLAQENTVHQTVFNCSLKIRQEEIQSRDKELEFKILQSLTQEMYKSKQLLTDFEFQKQNRYKNILAFKDTLVNLNLSLPLCGENYINANFVQNNFSKRQPLILTQGPKKQTATKFWQMLETHQCQTVVAILNKKEIGPKCFKYWPEKLMDSNLYLIETVANGQTSLFEYKKFKVLNKQTAVNFFVEHFLITAWKDHDTLNQRFFSKFMKFLYFLNDKRKRDNSPLVIHCSAGIGRSGTLAASLFLQEFFLKAKNQNSEFYFSVFDIVKRIREQRFKAVQNINQYSFLYELAKNFNQIFQNFISFFQESLNIQQLFLNKIIKLIIKKYELDNLFKYFKVLFFIVYIDLKNLLKFSCKFKFHFIFKNLDLFFIIFNFFYFFFNFQFLQMKILFLIFAFFTFTKGEDFQTSLSNRSVNFLYSLLPVLNPLFKEQEYDGFAVIDIDYFIQVQLQIEKMILHSLVLDKSERNSLQQLSENEYILTFPEINLDASCEVKVTKGMFSDLGNVELSIKKFIIQVTVEFKEENNELRMIPKDYKFDYEKFDVEIENQFIRYIWKILANHSFVKKYIMQKIGEKISSYIDDLNLYSIAQFQIKDEVFLFGLSEKPLFLEKEDEFFIITKIDLRKLNTISTNMEQQDYKNLMFTAKVPKISQLLKLALNNKQIVLNEYKQVADKLTVQNLQLAFPELANLYSDKMDTLMKVQLKLNFDDKDPLINRDFNTFLFQNVEINLQEKESEKQVCTLQLNSFINLMISSGEVEQSIVYLNMPNMRIVDLKANDCVFEVQTQQYKNILENLFKINLLGKRKYSFQDYQTIATGPYLYTKDDRFYFGLNIELDL